MKNAVVLRMSSLGVSLWIGFCPSPAADGCPWAATHWWCVMLLFLGCESHQGSASFWKDPAFVLSFFVTWMASWAGLQQRAVPTQAVVWCRLAEVVLFCFLSKLKLVCVPYEALGGLIDPWSKNKLKNKKWVGEPRKWIALPESQCDIQKRILFPSTLQASSFTSGLGHLFVMLFVFIYMLHACFPSAVSWASFQHSLGKQIPCGRTLL